MWLGEHSPQRDTDDSPEIEILPPIPQGRLKDKIAREQFIYTSRQYGILGELFAEASAIASSLDCNNSKGRVLLLELDMFHAIRIVRHSVLLSCCG